MITIDEVVTKLYTKLKTLGIPVFKYRSPIDYKGTFIVINSLPLQGRVEQQGVFNVNLYTDNNSNGTPNSVELNKYAKQIVDIVDNDWSNSELIEYQQSGYLYEETQTFINTRVNYRKLNYK